MLFRFEILFFFKWNKHQNSGQRQSLVLILLHTFRYSLFWEQLVWSAWLGTVAFFYDSERRYILSIIAHSLSLCLFLFNLVLLSLAIWHYSSIALYCINENTYTTKAVLV